MHRHFATLLGTFTATAFAAITLTAQQTGTRPATGGTGSTCATRAAAPASTGTRASTGAARATTGGTGSTGAKPATGSSGGTGSTGPKNNPAMSTPAALVNSERQAWVEKMIDVPKVGPAMAYVPKHAAETHVVLFFSGDGEWTLGVVDMARRFADRAMVVGLSYPKIRRAAPADKCWNPAADVEEIARGAEKALGLTDFHPPILVGYSSGATLVYAAFVGSPAGTYAGGMSLGFCPDLPANHPVCELGDWKPTFEVKKGGAILPKVAAVPHDWYVLIGVEDQVCNPTEMHTYLDDMKNAHMIDVPHSGHGFSNQPRWSPPFDESIAKLLAADTKSGPAARWDGAKVHASFSKQ